MGDQYETATAAPGEIRRMSKDETIDALAAELGYTPKKLRLMLSLIEYAETSNG